MAAAQESHSTNPIPSDTTPLLNSSPITFRKGTFFDSKAIGLLAAKTYHDTDLTKFISPYRERYPRDYEGFFVEMNRKRLLNARVITSVAVTKENNKEKIVGYAIFKRLGNDAGAQEVIRSQGLLWRIVFLILGFIYPLWCKVFAFFTGGDRSQDPKAAKEFFAWCGVDDEKHWKGKKDRENRWHAQSVVVDPEWHRRGIGKKLMTEMIERAEKEGVPIGLESSGPGERLYRSVGFELIARFTGETPAFDNTVGGIMIYKSKGWREGRGESDSV